MSFKSKFKLFFLIIFVLLSFNLYLEESTADINIVDPTVVLFDESHGQLFNQSTYSQALSDLEEKNLEIIFNKIPIIRTTLDGVDIFVSTNPTEFFTSQEQIFLSDYLVNGKSMLLLANPLIEENKSLNGGGVIFNEILTDAAAEIGGTEVLINFYTNPDVSESFKPTDVVRNDFINTGNPYHLKIDVNSSAHEILSGDQNVTSILTYSCSVQNAREEIIIASPEAHAETTLSRIHSYSSDIVLLGSAGPLDNGARILLGGSSIMFSDLITPFMNSTWYESENNSFLWQRMFDWLEGKDPAEENPTFNLDTAIVILSFIAVISLALIAIGSLFFMIGTGRKVKITKSEEIIPVTPVRTSITPKEDTKPMKVKSASSPQLSKRDRRLRQIQKTRRGKKR